MLRGREQIYFPFIICHLSFVIRRFNLEVQDSKSESQQATAEGYTTGAHSLQWVDKYRTGSGSDRNSIGMIIQVPVLGGAA